MEPSYTCYELPNEGLEERKHRVRELIGVLEKKGLYWCGRTEGIWISARKDDDAPVLAEIVQFWDVIIYEGNILKNSNRRISVLTEEERTARETIRQVLRDYQP